MLALPNDRDDLHEPSVREDLQAVLDRLGAEPARRLLGRLPDLDDALTRESRRTLHRQALATVAEAWLAGHVGAVTDDLRRAAVAALLLQTFASNRLPHCLRGLIPHTQETLRRFLCGPRPYDAGQFAADLALAIGAAAHAGAFTIAIPPPAVDAVLDRTRRTASGAGRTWLQHGPATAAYWLKAFASGRIAELHVDTRTLGEFNAAGIVRCYHRLAALMEARPDISGICGVSWLYDPQLPTISPNLAFVRGTLEEDGAVFLRLRTEPVQTAYAIARSPTRRRLYESGRYGPACYGMYWPRRALTDWARRAPDLRQVELQPERARRSAAAEGPRIALA